jgi:hypothetical protein
MTTRTHPAWRAPLALLLFVALAALIPATATAATTTAKLRVLTPTKVLDPGTTYIVDSRVTVPTRPDADCFGPPGGSGQQYTYDQPTALSLLATAARTSPKVRPLALTDQFGFGLGICGIGGQEAVSGQSFWYLKSNHTESTLGADQLQVEDGDQVLFYLAPDNFPNPNPKELELIAPARAQAGSSFTVRVVEHSCVTDQQTFEVSCTSQPAAGVSVSGSARTTGTPATAVVTTTAADGTAQITAAGAGTIDVGASRGADIPSEVLRVCVGERLDDCPAARGERLVGGPNGDRIKGTRGSDSIRARGGDDRVDLRKGGADALDCGPGRDKVLVKRSDGDDRIARDCDRVIRR